MRADASRNRDALLRAARELFVERGLDVPLEAVARHAGVGPATLYRRFPDRDALLRDVALLSLGQCLATAEAAAEELERAPDREAAEQVWQGVLATFARDWVAVLLLVRVRSTSPLADPELVDARRTTLASVDRLLTGLRAREVVRSDVTSFEVWTLLLAVVRPLPGVPSTYAAPLVQRHLALVVAGLRPGSPALAGVPVTQRDAEQVAAELAAASEGRQQESRP